MPYTIIAPALKYRGPRQVCYSPRKSFAAILAGRVMADGTSFSVPRRKRRLHGRAYRWVLPGRTVVAGFGYCGGPGREHPGRRYGRDESDAAGRHDHRDE